MNDKDKIENLKINLQKPRYLLQLNNSLLNYFREKYNLFTD